MNTHTAKPFLSLLLSVVAIVLGSLSSSAQTPSIIPQPDQVEWGSGSYELKKTVTVGFLSSSLRPAADYLQQLLERTTGSKVKVKRGSGNITLRLSPQEVQSLYSLKVGSQGVEIVGSDYQGVVSAIATLRQLMPASHETDAKGVRRQTVLPEVSIVDRPRYSWRGLELDVSRHFFSVEEVKELLDVMSLYKLNKFHWHLADDQGWRVEIKKYPLLTERGAWRTYNNQDSICLRRAVSEDNPDMLLPAAKMRTVDGRQVYGGYYTQEQVRDIVDYAKTRGIEIVPEIDMPGHSLTAINNYPGLSCFEQTGWGELFTTPLCPGKDKALAFYKDVYSEIFDLFPSKFIHVGGDEVDMKNWKKCPDCQKRMSDLNLKNESQLQAWMLGEMEKFLNANGREMIGWDEIIEGGLSPTSTVMWWRTWAPKSLDQATAHGNRVILTPNSKFYLDYSDREATYEGIYQYQHPEEGLTAAQSKLIQGVQGNIWTEWIPTREQMHKKAFPRALAVAELGWSKPSRMNIDDFNRRLADHFARLQALNIVYNEPHLTGFYDVNASTKPVSLNVECLDKSAVVRYTTDGTMPQTSSPEFKPGMVFSQTTPLRLRTFSHDGHKGDVVDTKVVVRDYAPAFRPDSMAGGLKAVWHEFPGIRCSEIDKAPVNETYIVDEVGIPKGVRGNIGLIITGNLSVPSDGVYLFELTSDDGSWLKIDGEMVVDNDKEHSMVTRRGQYPLAAGCHRLEVRYFDHNGGGLRLSVYDANGNKLDAAKLFSH